MGVWVVVGVVEVERKARQSLKLGFAITLFAFRFLMIYWRTLRHKYPK